MDSIPRHVIEARRRDAVEFFARARTALEAAKNSGALESTVKCLEEAVFDADAAIDDYDQVLGS